MYYNGWYYYFDGIGSQGWRALRHGVSMRANSETLLREMIDRKPTYPR